MNFGRMLIILGLVLLVWGFLWNLGYRLPLRLGRLPGDIHVQGKHFSFYFPLVTCLLLSLVLTLVMWLLRR
jgi:hypothetical protein